jgi:hypothetical protein
MKRKKQLPTSLRADCREFYELQHRLYRSKPPDEKDIARYRELALAHPGFLHSLKETSEYIRTALLGKMLDGNAKAHVLAEEDALKRDFGYKMASPTERLLIDQILTTRVHLLHAEAVFSDKIMQSLSFAAASYWQKFLSSAQRRYLRAIETLARVRRLARNGPLFQVNIANAGGRQVNCQGELFDLQGSPQPEVKSIDVG